MILLGDAAQVLKDFNDECIDLTVTSPPYDNLRTYGGYSFNFEALAKELYRVTKSGGFVVWVVNDATIDGSETGTSFRQALYFKEIGFKLHDTMIYEKTGVVHADKYTYYNIFEFMFILSKGRPKTFNPINDRANVFSGRLLLAKSKRNKKGIMKKQKQYRIAEYGRRFNIWRYHRDYDDLASYHPAIFPEQLAADHIKSWSKEGDLILDPFAGSGTTLKAAHQLNRKWIGIEINPEYVALAKKRLTPYIQQQRLETFISPLE